MSTVSAALAVAYADVAPATLRKWVQRGKVRSYGRDAYDLDDIATEIRRRRNEVANAHLT